MDARVYLGNSGTTDDARLITIGTPGSPLCDLNNIYIPAVYDILQLLNLGEMDTPNFILGPTTGHHNCPQQDWLLIEEEEDSYFSLTGARPNDGLVRISSVEAQGYSHNPRHIFDCHSNLLSIDEFDLEQDILTGR